MATGRKTVVVGQVIDPNTWGNPLWDQSVQAFADAADRTAQFPAPLKGAVSWLDLPGVLQVFDGASWKNLGPGQASTNAFRGSDQTVGPGAVGDLSGVINNYALKAGVRYKITGTGSVSVGGNPAEASVRIVITQTTGGVVNSPALPQTLAVGVKTIVGVQHEFFAQNNTTADIKMTATATGTGMTGLILYAGSSVVVGPTG